MISVARSIPSRIERRAKHHNERLRVAVRTDDLRGHHVERAGRFLLTSKRFAPDGKVILYFENGLPAYGDGWNRVGRNGVIRIPISSTESKQFVEGTGYTLYLYRW